jgi:hypothetical protein
MATLDELRELSDAWEDGRLTGGNALVDGLETAALAEPIQLAALDEARRKNLLAMAEAWHELQQPPAEHGFFDQRGNWVKTGVWR